MLFSNQTLDVLESHLRRTWGYASLRPMQRTVIEAVLDGKDVLGMLGTGEGKTLTYCLPSAFAAGLTLVVSPTLSLMADQVASLSGRGILVKRLGSDVSRGATQGVFKAVALLANSH